MHYPGSIDEVRWRQILPWLLLVPAARSSLLLSVLGITLAAAAATNFGWTAIGWLAGMERSAWPVDVEPTTEPASPISSASPDRWLPATQLGTVVWQNPLSEAWLVVVGPWLGVGSEDAPRGRIYQACCGLWSLAIWGLAGGAIAWISALRMTRQENASMKAGLRRAASGWLGAVCAPLVTMLAIVVLSLPVAAAGWLLRYEWSAVLVGFAWGLVLLFGLMLVALLLGVLLGWPLMVITATLDRSDPFDGVSRALAYVYQRPLHLAGYLLVAGVLAAIVDAGVGLAVEATIWATDSIGSYAAGHAGASDVFDAGHLPSSWSGWLIAGWRNSLRAGARWFPLALFWSLAAGMYLLLRFQIDETELDELAESGP